MDSHLMRRLVQLRRRVPPPHVVRGAAHAGRVVLDAAERLAERLKFIP